MQECKICGHDIIYNIKGWPVFRDGKRICEICEIRKIIEKAERDGKIKKEEFCEPDVLKVLGY